MSEEGIFSDDKSQIYKKQPARTGYGYNHLYCVAANGERPDEA